MYRTPAATAIAALAVAPIASAAITDFNEWTLLEDPPTPGLNASVSPDGSSATLTADAPPSINFSADVGYASVNGNTVAESTQGFYFRATDSFKIAIDFAIEVGDSPTYEGGYGFGFGIGEDAAGDSSAGVAAFATAGPPPTTIGGPAGRAPGIGIILPQFPTFPAQEGSLIVDYNGTTGSINVGVAQTPGNNTPDQSSDIAIAQFWDGDDLLVSFFLRGGLESGDIDATFSNFRVVSGNPIEIPEPATAALLAAGLGLIATRRR
ncbi:MAG: PEP-CTERM sorting domain-containing protein [Planctomycetota bacterium]